MDDIDRMARIAARPLRSYDPAIDKDDLRQHAAVALLRHSEIPVPLRVLRARSVTADLLRSAQVSRRAKSESLGFDPACRQDPSDAVQYSEFLSLALDPKYHGQAKIIRLLIDGHTPAEISAIQGRSLSSVQNTLSAAVHRLRAIYQTGVSGDARLGRCRAADKEEVANA